MHWKTLQETRRKLAREEGTIFKDWGGKLSVALIYPNTYALGMSNLGFQTLYGLLNRSERVVCERVFCEGHEPVSLESGRPLGDFDVLAFSFPYEQDYSNALALLKTSAIPPRSSDRDTRHPLVIAGGAAVSANPEPLVETVDAFVIGEAEAVLPDLLSVLLEGVESPRDQWLRELSRVSGVYVPLVSQGPIRRQVAGSLSDFVTGSVVLTPETELGDLYLMEIARGCGRGCRFCLAGYHFRPMRYRPADRLIAQAKEGLRYRDRVGLVSAAISDHPQIEELVRGLRGAGIAFSVSSIRVKPLSETLLQGLAESDTRSLALAPEAGSERLRRIIGKGISEEDILDAVQKVARHEFSRLKLYFMIGLPTETADDIMEIVRLAVAAKGVLERHRLPTRLTVNVTPFVPKAGTPFQWLPMASAGVLRDRLHLLERNLSRKGIELKADGIEHGIVQGTLSRGDRRVGRALLELSRFTPAEWRRALERNGVDPDGVHREIPADAVLPWGRIDSGISPARLRAEFEKAMSGGGARREIPAEGQDDGYSTER